MIVEAFIEDSIIKIERFYCKDNIGIHDVPFNYTSSLFDASHVDSGKTWQHPDIMWNWVTSLSHVGRSAHI